MARETLHRIMGRAWIQGQSHCCVVGGCSAQRPEKSKRENSKKKEKKKEKWIEEWRQGGGIYSVEDCLPCRSGGGFCWSSNDPQPDKCVI
ncbi:hypothetical protein BDV38DRAFT_78163 [Aspergillus pseudotamarii]|uniref:Uncharacterized protein n=1 Tax=Aspergillus pseudotamarii TaxID=132259 RepID=A0A5N6SWH2_ASPPS|nr:uncharacterized protein BDV38DRAFT_78163 [Aspergillus pseudotamarii]KAE8138080.1 hypothetical protein BDV38DRAFT_78163 [Aspergillus pseudotamarii]